MVKLMTTDQLIAIANGAGIPLSIVTPVEENLYVYATRVGGHNVYVGKSNFAGDGKPSKRSRNETKVAGEGFKARIGVGFSALITENDAVRRPLRYEPELFDPSVLLQHIEMHGWSGPPIETLLARLKDGSNAPQALSVEEVEQVLIRIHVCTGRLIGNSQFASQWEKGVFGVPNIVAVLAADIAREGGVHLADDRVIDEALEELGVGG